MWGDDFIVPYEGLRGVHNALSITHVKLLRISWEDFFSVIQFMPALVESVHKYALKMGLVGAFRKIAQLVRQVKKDRHARRQQVVAIEKGFSGEG